MIREAVEIHEIRSTKDADQHAFGTREYYEANGGDMCCNEQMF